MKHRVNLTRVVFIDDMPLASSLEASLHLICSFFDSGLIGGGTVVDRVGVELIGVDTNLDGNEYFLVAPSVVFPHSIRLIDSLPQPSRSSL